jgi:hypothetical protein
MLKYPTLQQENEYSDGKTGFSCWGILPEMTLVLSRIPLREGALRNPNDQSTSQAVSSGFFTGTTHSEWRIYL